VPYLTPDELPEADDCRPLLIPASSVWLAIVSGALTELTKTWNWEKFGTLTVDECVSAMGEMIATYYDGCQPCTLPGGFRVIRIGEDGHLEELDDTGNWVPSTGDYAYPPIPIREGGSVGEQKCLAAENAENVLHQIYEQLADYFASELTPAEALTALIAWLIATFGIASGTIIYALGQFILPVLTLVWGALSYLTVDLWDGNFSNALKCTLLDCATDTDGVVTFDWDCIEHELYAAAVSFGINEVQLRLYAQVNYIIWILGGVDALNTMGATTAITTAACDDCGDHCFVIDFRDTDGSEFGVSLPFANATWTSGIGYVANFDGGGGFYDVTVLWTFPDTLTCKFVEVTYTKITGAGDNDTNNLRALSPVINYATTQVAINSDNGLGTYIGKLIELDSVAVDGMSADINSGNGSSDAPIVVRMIVRYSSDIPDGWTDNC